MATLLETGLGILGIGSGLKKQNDPTSGRNGTGTDNPYKLFYKNSYGHVFGKPLVYLPRTDPNQRIYQKTFLRNNTIINIIPGIPYQDEAMLEKAKEILTKYNEEYERIKVNGGSKVGQELDKLTEGVRIKLGDAKVDLRYAIFKSDTAGFMRAYQLLISRTGTAIFGASLGGIGGFLREASAASITESYNTGGFKVWVEKGTSISETVSNTFTKSVLENTQKQMSDVVKQLKFLGKGLGMGTTLNDENVDVVSGHDDIQSMGQAGNIASKTAGGAVFDFPQIFDSTEFTRSYEISFRFTSPYGDDRSVANHVIFPFLFLLTCALPRQDGPSGHQSPFLVQVDAPGFFSCPMGVVTALSFRKGGDDMLFNDRGLPLVIEGSMTVADLYSNMSLPLNNGQFATNFGTSAFLANLGGLTLYSAIDMTLSDTKENFLKGMIAAPRYAWEVTKAETYNILRFLGVPRN